MAKTKKVFLGIGVLAAIAVITFAFAIAASGSDGGVIEQNAKGVTVAASEVTSSINYQGRLTDSAGEPLSGTYTMTFGLYDVSTGGTALATDTHDVDVTDGLFNTGIDFGTSDFDGRELWLGVKVGTDSEMTPRQELRPMPYALSLVPGARIDGSVSGPVLKINNTGTGAGVHGVYGETSGNWGWASGVYGKATEDYAIGVTGRNTGSGAGVYGWSDEGPGVIGTSDNDTGMYGIGKYGGYFTTNQGGTSGNHNAGVNATTTHDYSDGVRASTTGYDSDGVHASTTGNNSEGVLVYTTGYFSEGVFAETTGYGSGGVRAKTTGGNSEGISANTYGNGSEGVYVHTHGDDSYGVRAHTNGDDSYAVYAFTWGDGSDGVRAYTFGVGSDGVRVDTSGECSHGVRVDTSGDYSYGVSAHTTGVESVGVRVATTGGSSPGVHAETTGDDSYGVFARTTGDRSEGVRAYTTGDDSDGVFARSTNHHGVYGRTDSADSAGVYARGIDSGADLILGGNANTGAGDDGAIYSDPDYTSSDIFLITNDGLAIVLDKNGDGEDADFGIHDKDNKLIFNVDESGDVSYGGPNIAAFPRPAYDSGWVSISKGTTKTLTHNLGGNADNYVVDMQFQSSMYGRNQKCYGGYHFRSGVVPHKYSGAYWKGLDDTQIKVFRFKSDDAVSYVRVRIWVYK